ncbi:hypothetical protein [Shivajiella indica]|uniref:DUF2147 domain-containing protein n=1 Tax=Shivajiella indica TaxID=872115 RepID=A0ABW5BAE3_9BACT
MKKLAFFLIGIMFCVTIATFAQYSDYFIGTWDIIITDTPQGNVNARLTLERVEGKLIGKFSQAGASQETTVSNINEDENGITLFFFAEGYDLYLKLNPEEGDKLSGYLIDQFPVRGERVK